MKINSIYISAFGGIKNLEISLKEGFNLIYGENEQGKTTLMNFIKMMFYGSGRTSSQIYKNIRKKYTPWDNSSPAGSITFEHSGVNYRLEREFSCSDSKDKVTLFNLDLGTRQSADAQPGLSFFDLSPAAFERSVFIGQLGFQDSNPEAEGELNAKLSNLALTGDTDISFETVNARLEKAKNLLMSKSGKTGEYDKNLKAYQNLNERITRTKQIHEIYEEKTKEISLAEEKIRELTKEYIEIKEKISSENDIRNAQKYQALLDAKAELDQINKSCLLADGTPVDENYLRSVNLCISKYEISLNKLENKKQEIKLLEENLNPNTTTDGKEQIDLLEKEISELEQNLEDAKNQLQNCQNQPEQKVKSNALGFILGIGFLIIGLITLFTILQTSIIYAISFLLGIGFIIFGFISKKQENLNNTNNEKTLNEKILSLNNNINEISNEILLKKIRIEGIKAALNTNAVTAEQQQATLKNLYEQKQKINDEVNENFNILKTQALKYKKFNNIEDLKWYLEDLSEFIQVQKEKKQQLNFLLNDLNGISYEDAKEKLEAVKEKSSDTQLDFDALKNRLDFLGETITEGKTRISAQKAKAKAEIDSAEDLSQLEIQLKVLSDTINEQKAFCNAIDIAIENLTESFAKVRSSFGSVLEQKSAEIFKGITGGKYIGVNLTKSFDIGVSIKDSFGSKELDYLSSGTVDQAYLSLKLALIQLMCQDSEHLPIFLDDVLTQYDDKRAKLATQYLKEFSKNYQSVMFTCHNYIKDISKELGANIITL